MLPFELILLQFGHLLFEGLEPSVHLIKRFFFLLAFFASASCVIILILFVFFSVRSRPIFIFFLFFFLIVLIFFLFLLFLFLYLLLSMTEHDAPLGQVVDRDLNINRVSHHALDAQFFHFATETADDGLSGFTELDNELSARRCIYNLALDLYDIFFLLLWCVVVCCSFSSFVLFPLLSHDNILSSASSIVHVCYLASCRCHKARVVANGKAVALPFSPDWPSMPCTSALPRWPSDLPSLFWIGCVQKYGKSF
mmetsp:Transcript_130148/g.230013  ORF Transcript_130148/g.230013 Transcript_130148/m.230013 type:complete len:253 (+) Transcript_130148:899-1657(+)